MNEDKFDAVVVGAGPAGTIFSSDLAEAGFDVALIDRKAEDKIGEKVCGGGISRGYFNALDLEKPTGKELSRKIKRAEVFSPDMKGKLNVEGEGFTINRQPFGQRLLKAAKKEGAQIFTNTMAIKPIIKGGVVSGVTVKNMEKKEKRDIKARVTMDASGITGAIRSKVPKKSLIETKINKFDIDLAHRYIASLPNEEWDWREHSINIYLNQKEIPGGYGWVFPKENNKLNVGIGIQALGKSVPPKKVTDKFLEDVLDINPKDLNIIDSGAGIVPVRRPLSMLVTDGLVLAGDAASNANPLHGGGIGHAMEAAHLAAQEIIPKLDKNEEGVLSKAEMWSYSKKYFEENGGKNAALQVIRLALQGFSNKDLNYLIKSGLISGEQLTLLQSSHDQGLGILKKISAGLRLTIFHRSLKKRLNDIQKLYDRVYEFYRNYPEDPSKIIEWHKRGRALMDEAKEKLWQDPYRWWGD